ncbi:hypothetical protein [Flavihumibacter sp. CACIAM 22H1]|uniref:hypothetical protein n=1 Tax=Flavihumibacter sp. CACIAM 22H1 TaxID=1812911 RepID=UPI0007A9338D|nr:hypothetical protein [Flavihumibacter sp. CACIAM 22H1]KYP14372.1 MAG: hypothetical protein A1D16_11645 [Flavihumibacter sp. CACIAM 22H1]
MKRFHYSKGQVLLLGTVLLKRFPFWGAELLKELDEYDIPPFDNDLINIERYFKVFCDRNLVKEDDIRINKWSRQRSNKIKVFTAAMLRIYRPFKLTMRDNELMPGFNIRLSNVIGMHSLNITKLLKELEVYEKAYDDFRYEVEYTEHYLKVAKERFDF